MNEEYKNHITDCIEFADTVVKKAGLSGWQGDKIAILILDKIISPYHYFIDNKDTVNNHTPATEKQITFAKKIGIETPEKHSKKDLSKLIDDTLAKQKKQEKGG